MRCHIISVSLPFHFPFQLSCVAQNLLLPLCLSFTDNVCVFVSIPAKASLEHFRRALEGLEIADGKRPVQRNSSTTGDPKATRTQSFVPLPTSSDATDPTASRTLETAAQQTAN